MSAPVDVLAVMVCDGIAAEEWRMQQVGDKAATAAMKASREALGAVAELVKADREFDHAAAYRIEADNRIVSGDRSDDAFRKQASAHHSYDRAADRRRAALANIGGAQ